MSLARSEILGYRPPALAPEPLGEAVIDDLRQRVRLFELILADLSGPQTILRREKLPSCLVSGAGRYRERSGLRSYAAELIRCPDGILRVAGDLVAGADNHSSAYLLERPAVAEFLPGLCRFLLGEPLRLASVPSRWLADPGALREVATSLHRWVIISAFSRGPATRPATLTAAQRGVLQDQIDAAPWQFAARLLIEGDAERVALARTEQGAWMLNGGQMADGAGLQH